MSAGSSTQAAKRVVGRPWVKGQSGNPRGRAASDFEIQRLCRAHTVPAVNALIRALKDPKTRVTAAMGILAYAYGRPMQADSQGPVEDETVTFVLKIVGEPSAHGLNGSSTNGAHRVITLPAPSNDNGNDDDND